MRRQSRRGRGPVWAHCALVLLALAAVATAVRNDDTSAPLEQQTDANANANALDLQQQLDDGAVKPDQSATEPTSEGDREQQQQQDEEQDEDKEGAAEAGALEPIEQLNIADKDDPSQTNDNDAGLEPLETLDPTSKPDEESKSSGLTAVQQEMVDETNNKEEGSATENSEEKKVADEEKKDEEQEESATEEAKKEDESATEETKKEEGDEDAADEAEESEATAQESTEEAVDETEQREAEIAKMKEAMQSGKEPDELAVVGAMPEAQKTSDYDAAAGDNEDIGVDNTAAPNGVEGDDKQQEGGPDGDDQQQEGGPDGDDVDILNQPANPTNVDDREQEIENSYAGPVEYGGFEYGGESDNDSPSGELDISAKCVSWGFPHHMTTFDYHLFSFQGSGEFVAYRRTSPYTAPLEQVNLVLDLFQSVARTRGVSMRYGDAIITMELFSETGDASREVPRILVRDQDITESVLSRTETRDAGFIIKQDGVFGSDKSLVVSATNPEGTSVVVTFFKGYRNYHLNVFIEVPPTRFGKTQGLCGLFDFRVFNDIVDPSGKEDGIDTRRAAAWSVQAANESLSSPDYTVRTDPVVAGEPSPLQLADGNQKLVELATSFCTQRHVGDKWMNQCLGSTILGGDRGAQETAMIEELAYNGRLVPSVDALTCMASGQYLLSGWSLYTPCSSPCGKGFRNRTRTVKTAAEGEEASDCGVLTQIETCFTECDKADVWGRCVAWGKGHFLTFDRQEYDFQGAGEYTLYKTATGNEQINIMSTRESTFPVSHVVAAGLRFGPDVFTVSLLPDDYTTPLLRYNGRQVEVGMSNYFGLFTVSKVGVLASEQNRDLIIEVKVPGGTTMTVAFYSYGLKSQLTVYAEVSGEKIGTTSGLCGTYDFDPLNDFKDSASHVVKKNAFGTSWTVRQRDSIFYEAQPVYKAPPKEEVDARLLSQGDHETLMTAGRACGYVGSDWVQQCVIDVLVEGPTGLNVTRDTERVMEEGAYSWDRTAVDCLRQRGTKLGDWSDWSECTEACGGGRASRSRTVTTFDGQNCGELHTTKLCDSQPCPKDCVLSEWSTWAECPVECGKGTTTRIRTVVRYPAFGGANCSHLEESKECIATNCCKYGQWQEWDACSGGKQHRARAVQGPEHCGPKEEWRECCQVGEWSEWDNCYHGKQSRTRSVVGPNYCGHKAEIRDCCQVGEWSDWDSCTNGKQARYRDVFGPSYCGHQKEVRPCCESGEWTEWSECKDGYRIRTRELSGSHCGESKERQPCNCKVGNWTNWSPCQSGKQTRSRVVSHHSCGEAEQSKVCSCHVGDWSPWTNCTGGKQVRTRVIRGDNSCGHSHEEQLCETKCDESDILCAGGNGANATNPAHEQSTARKAPAATSESGAAEATKTPPAPKEDKSAPPGSPNEYMAQPDYDTTPKYDAAGPSTTDQGTAPLTNDVKAS